MAQIGDHVVDRTPSKLVRRDRFLQQLMGGAGSLLFHDRYIGVSRRRDAWRCDGRRFNAHWLLLLLDEGEVRGRVADRPFMLAVGDVLWVPAMARHDMRWPENLHFAEVYFRLEESGRSLNPESVMLIRRGGLGLRSTFDRLADEVQLAGTYTDQQRRALLASLLVQFWRLENESAKTGEAFHPLTVDQQSRLVRLTRRRILEGISPAELAESVGLSGDYFSRRFRETFGISPRVWLNRQRIEASRRLLEETDLTINQVADRLGYAGAAQFSRQFSKVLGVSPGAYRSSV